MRSSVQQTFSSAESGAVGEFRFPQLRLWVDPVARGGYENMATDELLLRQPEPWLRIYGWRDACVSFGYFDSALTARSIFPGASHYIRRWTGGGIVDHRHGITYTLTLPAPPADAPPHPQASVLYEHIHGALAHALQKAGVDCTLLAHDAPSGGRACWASPVMSDIVDSGGHKLAGAGQRRFRGAILHQGLIQQCSPHPGWEIDFAYMLAPVVNIVNDATPWLSFDAELQELCTKKYLSPAWEDESHGRRKPSVL